MLMSGNFSCNMRILQDEMDKQAKEREAELEARRLHMIELERQQREKLEQLEQERKIQMAQVCFFCFLLFDDVLSAARNVGGYEPSTTCGARDCAYG